MKRSWLLALPLLIAGCGGDSSSTPAARVTMSYPVDLTSVATNLKTMDNGTKVAGWNQLTGTATVNGQSVDIEFQADVSYVNGSGDFGGYYTMTFPDDSTLTLRSEGRATKNSDGSTNFVSTLKVLGGTGTYVNAIGTGQFTGSRAGVLGAPVRLDVQASLR